MQEAFVSATPDLDSPEFSGTGRTHSPEALLWAWVLNVAMRDFLAQAKRSRQIPPMAWEWLNSPDLTLICHWLGMDEAYIREQVWSQLEQAAESET